MNCSNRQIYTWLGVAVILTLLLVGGAMYLHLVIPEILPYVATTALGALVMAARPGSDPSKDEDKADAS